jgi:hypothetical protein
MEGNQIMAETLITVTESTVAHDETAGLHNSVTWPGISVVAYQHQLGG